MKKHLRKVVLLFKKTFIPHTENNYKPHFFREHTILSFLIGSILLLLISYTSYLIIQKTSYGSSVVSSVLIDLTNHARKDNNLPPLLYNETLTEAATLKGNDMLERNYFSHFAPDGTTPWYWFSKAGYQFLYAGENLATNFRSSTEVEKAWMASPKHRGNILGGQFVDIGIATVRGTIDSVPVIFIVQLFGAPSVPLTPPSLMPIQKVGPPHLYEKILFNASYYINSIYVTFVIIVMIALLMMICIEIRQQHYIHILYGILMIIIVCMCIAINSLLM